MKMVLSRFLWVLKTLSPKGTHHQPRVLEPWVKGPDTPKPQRGLRKTPFKPFLFSLTSSACRKRSAAE